MLTFGRLLTFKNLIMRKTVFLCSFLLALSASAEKLIKTTPETFLQDLESVKQAVQNQSEDIVVELKGGTYTLTQPLTLDEAYSGRNGHKVIFRAAQGETPVISGGVRVTGWQHVSGPLYKAPLKSNEKLRSLFVNGERCRMAGGRALEKGMGTVDSVEIKGTEPWALGAGKNVDGIKFMVGKELNLFRNPEDIELVQKRVWSEKIICVRDMEKWGDTIVVRLQQPYGYIVNSLGWAAKLKPLGGDFYVRNAYELLDEPGEFYFDRKEQMLYYYSRGENMAEAEVIAPVSQGLLRIHGSSLKSRVENLTFEGLTFSYDAWNLMEVVGSHGFCGIQSLGLSVKYIPDGNWHPHKYNNCDVPEGAVDVQNAKNIRFERNNFLHISAGAGVCMMNDVQHSQVIGNRFMDMSGTSVVVGHPQHYEIGDGEGKYSPEVEGLCQYINVSNNYVRNVCLDFRQIEGMIAFFVANCNFDHNDIQYTPYGAIAVGWWWGNAKTPPCKLAKKNSISYNKAGYTHQFLHDGGILYMLGHQPGSVLNRNYLFKGPRCIYPDDGSAGWRINENVVDALSQLWYHLASDRNYDIIAKDNYVKDNRLIDNGTGTKVLNTHAFRNTDFSDAAKKIMSEAGIEPAYRDIIPAEEPAIIHLYPEFPAEAWHD